MCNDFTKYTCLKCKVYVCNRGIECSVPVSEDYPGWKNGSSVALCDACDKKETYATNFSLQETDSEQNDSESNNSEPDDSNSIDGTEYRWAIVFSCAAQRGVSAHLAQREVFMNTEKSGRQESISS